MSAVVNFRIEGSFKEELQALDTSLSGLFRHLGLLVLGYPIPEDENGDNLNGRLFSQMEDQVSKWEQQVYGQNIDLTPPEWNAVRSLLDQAHRFTQASMRREPSLNRHRGLLLAGRLSMLWFEYCDRVAPPVMPPLHLRA